jgi:Ca2+/Na+ antiporter
MFKDRKFLIYNCNVFAIGALSLTAKMFNDYKYLFFIIAIAVYGYFSFKMVKEIESEFENHGSNFLALFQYLLVVFPIPIILGIVQ